MYIITIIAIEEDIYIQKHILFPFKVVITTRTCIFSHWPCLVNHSDESSIVFALYMVLISDGKSLIAAQMLVLLERILTRTILSEMRLFGLKSIHYAQFMIPIKISNLY